MKKLFESWRRFVINEREDTTKLSQEDYNSPEFQKYYTALMKVSKMVGHDVAIDDPSIDSHLDKAIGDAMKNKYNYDSPDRIDKLFNRTRMLQDLKKIILNNAEYAAELANVERYGNHNQDNVVGGPIYDFSDDEKDDVVGPELSMEEFIELINQKDEEESKDIDLDDEEPF